MLTRYSKVYFLEQNCGQMIEAQSLKKVFGTFEAVSDVSFCAQAGKIVGLLGPNGAGKTTTIRMLTGYLKPSSGQVLIEGKKISEQNKINIGYLPESPPIYPELKVCETLKFWAGVKEVKDYRKDTILEQCGLTDVSNKLCGQLSKGFKQRVGLAIALISNPQILILDEPTSGLDPLQIAEMRSLIMNLKDAGRAVILSSHVMQEVSEICTDVVIVSKGQVVASAELAKFTESGAKTLESSFLEAISK